jgi:hypothetical protein
MDAELNPPNCVLSGDSGGRTVCASPGMSSPPAPAVPGFVLSCVEWCPAAVTRTYGTECFLRFFVCFFSENLFEEYLIC